MIFDYSETVERVLRFPLGSGDPQVEGQISHPNFGWCPFDRRNIPVVFSEHDSGLTMQGGDHRLDIWACSQCGWWQLDRFSTWENDLRTFEGSNQTQRHAVLRRFAVDSLEVPVALLRSYLRKNPEQIYGIAPHKMEILAQSVFSDFFQCTVEHCGRSNDGGVDLYFITADTSSFVQVKRRENPRKTESVATVREFLGAMMLGGADRGYIVSTSENFSREAKKAARAAEQLSLVEAFELIDAGRFFDMLELVNQDEEAPWMKYTHEFRKTVERIKASWRRRPT